MKANVFDQYGGPEVLRYTDAPDPEVGPGDVLVRVRACAINHLDLWVRQGLPRTPGVMPHILGADAAGDVAAVGAEVTGFAVGDRVFIAPGMGCGVCRCVPLRVRQRLRRVHHPGLSAPGRLCGALCGP